MFDYTLKAGEAVIGSTNDSGVGFRIKGGAENTATGTFSFDSVTDWSAYNFSSLTLSVSVSKASVDADVVFGNDVHVNLDANDLQGACFGIKTITISGTADTSSVPEPSAFGLLAGIGALALVASRRRRK